MATHKWLISLLAGLSLMVSAGIACSQDLPQFSDAAYQALADASSPATIPPGTVITMQNWQQYKQFMTIGMQLLWSGKAAVMKLPADAQMEVGPTIPIPLPKIYLQNTEKYSAQAKLVKQENGGYHVEGYVAGLPFPNVDMKDPLAAYKLAYNEYYRYIPHVGYRQTKQYVKDRYGNVQSSALFTVYWRLKHLSDPGMGLEDPKNNGYDMIQYIETTAPEQSRYAASVKTFYDDPSKQEDIFSYTPSLRRAIRLSSMSRCAPATGGDTLFDDTRQGFGIHPSDFSARLFGRKKVLLVQDMNETLNEQLEKLQAFGPAFEANVYQPLLFFKPVYAKWQVTDAYVMDYRRLPSAGAESYCYGSRVLYQADTNASPGIDLYDNGLKFWKVAFIYVAPETIPNTGGDIFAQDSNNAQYYVDLQNDHVTISTSALEVLNTEVPAQFRNIERYGLPSGLDQITQ